MLMLGISVEEMTNNLSRAMRAINGIPDGCGEYEPCEKVMTLEISDVSNAISHLIRIDPNKSCKCLEREKARQTKEKAIEEKSKIEYWRCDCCNATNKDTDKICVWCRSVNNAVSIKEIDPKEHQVIKMIND